MSPGETHNVANFRALLRFVTVDRTIFAGRLRLQRTSATPGDGIIEEFTTLGAESAIVPSKRGKRGVTGHRLGRCRVVMRVAPAGDKERQHTKILELFAGQGEGKIRRFHRVTIHHLGRAKIDQNQPARLRLPSTGVWLQDNSLETENNLDSPPDRGYKDNQKGPV